MSTTIRLAPAFFTELEKSLVDHNAIGLSASLFRFASGVEAVRLKNGAGELVILPYQGQQIWQAVMGGRDLTMRSMFTQPAPTQDFLRTYGAFFLHCGFTAMGPAPEPTDHYPLHGELPNARYDDAFIEFGADARGEYIALGGSYRHTVAFAYDYVARPLVKLYAGSTLFTVSMQIENLKRTPMDYMYLGHINFRPVDGSRLVYSARVSPQTVRVRTSIPAHIQVGPDYRALIDRLAQHPEQHHEIRPDLRFDPEAVFSIDYVPDAQGLGHTLQILPDGSADYVRHRVAELPRVLRWMNRTADQDAIGMAEVATAEGEGYTRERAKGNVPSLAAGATWRCDVDIGTLSAAEVGKLRGGVEQIMGSV
jgi:hypothetical protein